MTYWRNVFVVLVALLAPLVLTVLVKASLGAGFLVGVGAAFLTVLVVRSSRQNPSRPAPDLDVSATPKKNPTHDVLELLPDALILLGPLERVEFANRAARAIYPGFEPGILLSTLVRHPEVLAVAQLARAKGAQTDMQFCIRRPKERFLKVMALPLERERLVLYFQDETELHHAEHLRAGFLANVSHELRTPLASLSGYIETLRGHAKDDVDVQDKFLAIMTDQAGRMGRLIDDLLSLSRIEMDEHLPPKATVDLVAVLNDVCDAITPMTKGRNIHLVLDHPAEPLPIIGDRDQVIQIAQNLIDNAIKYTPDGGRVMVTLKAASTRKDQSFAQKTLGEDALVLSIVETPRQPDMHYAVLEVRDQGPGISAEHLPRLGGRFYRVEQGKTGDRSGTGLGLAIVKHIVNRHRGGLHVQSKPGLGTVFTVAFPCTS